MFEGRDGNDTLIGDWGGDGRDTLAGGTGRNRLWDGEGRDLFDFNALSHSRPKSSERDLIMDFERGRDDIDLSTIDANTWKSGNQAFVFIGTEKFHFAPVEVRYSLHDLPGAENDRTRVAADINGDGKADLQIYLIGLHALSKGDFIL